MTFPALPLDLPTATKPYALTPQKDITRCQLCSQSESSDRPFVAVLTNFAKKEHHFVHAGECHQKHSDRIKAEREERARARSAA